MSSPFPIVGKKYVRLDRRFGGVEAVPFLQTQVRARRPHTAGGTEELLVFRSLCSHGIGRVTFVISVEPLTLHNIGFTILASFSRFRGGWNGLLPGAHS